MRSFDRGRRLLVAALAGALTLPVLAACTPAETRLVGVRMEQGSLVIEPARCPDEQVADLSVVTEADGKLESWVALPRTPTAQADPAKPAELGPDWASSGDLPGAPRTGATYRIGVSVSRDGLLDPGKVRVDGATLLGLGPDQVVVGHGTSGSEVVSVADFRKQVAAHCA
ncbi:hypothetical protein [Kitasatospora sp. NPDC002040]|uniref:hypothetical protein n=1 Tax=Kitasatospora sp. NPDC002040 TaxID=3154661 RepID=UPI003328E0C6